MKPLEERIAILENEITRQLKNGWRMESKTGTGCQLIKDKRPETCLIVFLLLLFIIPGIIYLIVSKKTTTVFVEVNEQGEIVYTGRDLSPYELQEANKQANARITDFINSKATDSHVTNVAQSTNDLGLLTISNISEGLKIPEDEVLKLIKTDQLKGKKIGDKYFVRREDFDDFMKK